MYCLWFSERFVGNFIVSLPKKSITPSQRQIKHHKNKRAAGKVSFLSSFFVTMSIDVLRLHILTQVEGVHLLLFLRQTGWTGRREETERTDEGGGGRGGGGDPSRSCRVGRWRCTECPPPFPSIHPWASWAEKVSKRRVEFGFGAVQQWPLYPSPPSTLSL